jgi:hypothetical protein
VKEYTKGIRDDDGEDMRPVSWQQDEKVFRLGSEEEVVRNDAE